MCCLQRLAPAGEVHVSPDSEIQLHMAPHADGPPRSHAGLEVMHPATAMVEAFVGRVFDHYGQQEEAEAYPAGGASGAAGSSVAHR